MVCVPNPSSGLSRVGHAHDNAIFVAGPVSGVLAVSETERSATPPLTNLTLIVLWGIARAAAELGLVSQRRDDELNLVRGVPVPNNRPARGRVLPPHAVAAVSLSAGRTTRSLGYAISPSCTASTGRDCPLLNWPASTSTTTRRHHRCSMFSPRAPPGSARSNSWAMRSRPSVAGEPHGGVNRALSSFDAARRIADAHADDGCGSHPHGAAAFKSSGAHANRPQDLRRTAIHDLLESEVDLAGVCRSPLHRSQNVGTMSYRLISRSSYQ